MNSSTSPQTPDLEKLRKAVQEYQSNRHRVPFSNLTPYRDVIVELRAKTASYEVIAELLQQHGVKTSRARVAEYGRVVLSGGKTRKRRRVQRIAPEPTVAPTIEPKPQPTHAPEQSANETRRAGPRIAHVRLLNGGILASRRRCSRHSTGSSRNP